MAPPRFDASNSSFLLAVIVSCRYCFISFSNSPAVTVSFFKFVVSFFSHPAVIVSFHFPIVQSFFNCPVQKNKDFAIAGIRTINLRISRQILTPKTTMPRLGYFLCYDECPYEDDNKKSLTKKESLKRLNLSDYNKMFFFVINKNCKIMRSF